MAQKSRTKYDSPRMPSRKTDDLVKPNPRIPRKLVDALRIVADADRHSLNDQIVIAIEEYLASRKKAKKGR